MKEDLGVTSLVITHDMKSAYAISDRIAMLFEGRVVEVGTPEEIKRTENRIVRGFVEGRPEMIEEAEAKAAADEASLSSRASRPDTQHQADGHHAGRAPHRRDA
jgi:phospholipid/cholesterol/gamma-HCH transport system ATP-binding protein